MKTFVFGKCKFFNSKISIYLQELENAAEAGLELNKMVSELLSSQSGSDSIISSVEELQKQLNEQQGDIKLFLICFYLFNNFYFRNHSFNKCNIG